MKSFLSLPFLALLLAGCAMTKPNAVDRLLYNVQTNWTVAIVTQTNTVQQTNLVSVTNVTGQVLTTTNVVTERQVVTETNQVPTVTLAPKPAVETGIQTGGGILGSFTGWGGLIGTVLLGAYHLYGQVRNKQVAGALVQGLETAREVVRSTPQGQQLAAGLTSYLVRTQGAAGVLGSISDLVGDLTDNGQAKVDAASIVTPPK